MSLTRNDRLQDNILVHHKKHWKHFYCIKYLDTDCYQCSLFYHVIHKVCNRLTQTTMVRAPENRTKVQSCNAQVTSCDWWRDIFHISAMPFLTSHVMYRNQRAFNSVSTPAFHGSNQHEQGPNSIIGTHANATSYMFVRLDSIRTERANGDVLNRLEANSVYGKLFAQCDRCFTVRKLMKKDDENQYQQSSASTSS